jgi:hypothetical protein
MPRKSSDRVLINFLLFARLIDFDCSRGGIFGEEFLLVKLLSLDERCIARRRALQETELLRR